MKRKYGIPNVTAEQVSQQEQTPASSTAPDASAVFDAPDTTFLDGFSHLAGTRSSRSPVVKVDACDIKEGFLTTQYHLLTLFRRYLSKAQDKHPDQFLARAPEEPTKFVPSVQAVGIFGMSRIQTEDGQPVLESGSGHVASGAAPSTVATSAPLSSLGLISGVASASAAEPPPAPSTSTEVLQKRKQKDGKDEEDAATDNGNDGGEGPSSPKQEPKRQRKDHS